MTDAVVWSNPPAPDDPTTFGDCRWKVDEAGCLHIFRPLDSQKSSMVAAFGRDGWARVQAAESQR